jgi:hypothetical protein
MEKIAGTLLMVLIGLGFNGNQPNKMDAKAAYSNRPTVETISYAKGFVKKIPGDEPVYIIDCPDKYLRLHAINLPATFKKEGLNVTVSGNIKATNTLEDAYGELFEVTSIQ